jgi:Tol biopolymer transport system component
MIQRPVSLAARPRTHVRAGWISLARALALVLAVGLAVSACGPSEDAPSTDGSTVSTRQLTVTLTEGTNMAADVSPDGETLVLALQGGLWTLSASGGEATPLDAGLEITHPVWSPDGDRIAFQTFVDHYYQIWVVEADGSDPRPLTEGHADHREPAWSPDGSRVAFSSDRAGEGSYDIWSVDVDTGELVRWTSSAAEEHSPTWSPDGGRVAYVEGAAVRAVDGSGAEEVLVTDGSGAVIAPSWAPDGRLAWQDRERRLLVDGTPVPGADGAATEADGAAGDASREDVFPFPVRWMADGGFLYTADGAVRVRDAAGNHREDIPFEATLALDRPVPAENPRRLDAAGPHPVRGIFAPTLSPDGEQVAFTALNDLWVMPLGGEPVRLTDDAYIEWAPSWAPDGRTLWFNSDRHGNGLPEMYSIDLETREITRRTELPGARLVFPVLSPDGDRVAYIDGSDQSLRVLEVATGTSRLVAEQAYASNVGRPSWSPDGRYIVLADIQPFSARFREGRNLIRVVEVATGEATFHEPGPLPAQLSERFEAGPAWSPDGAWMAFTMNSVLHVLPVAPDGTPTGPARQLTDHIADLPSWAPDSRSVLYLSEGRLRSVGVDGTGPREIEVPLTWTPVLGEGERWIRAGGMWDGVEPTLQGEVLIRVSGGRIEEIAPYDAERHGPEAAAAAGAEYVDGSELVAMPGLWDAHIHPRVQDFAAGWWAVQLAYGITTVLSNGTSTYHTLLAKESIDAGRWIGPRLLAAPIYDGTRTYYGHHRSVSSHEVLEMELAAARALEMDYLKAYVRSPADVMARVGEAAAEMGISSGSHFLSPGIQAGLGGTTHLSATQRMGYSWAESADGRSYQDVIALYTEGDFDLSSHHVRTNQILGEEPGLMDDPRVSVLMPRGYLPQLEQQASRPPTEAERQATRADVATPARILRGGGLVALGSDSPVAWPALGLHAQLRAFATAVSPHEALQSVTINAARYTRLDHELGTLEPGKIADLVLVRGNPLEDVANAARVELVVKAGVDWTQEEIRRPWR